MPSTIVLHLDPTIKKLTIKRASKLEFRACCICGSIRDVEQMEECLNCDRFMCPGHNRDEHYCTVH